MVERRTLVGAGILALVQLVVVTGPTVAAAAEHVVHLVTESEAGRFRFEPPLLSVAPGDTVRFSPDSRLHASKSIAGMLPEGAAPWRSRLGEEIVVRLDVPGVYGVKCPAHYEVGMVGLILVGGSARNWNAARAVRHPPMPTEVLQQLFARAACRLDRGSRPDCQE
jgi:pseudoazurin